MSIGNQKGWTNAALENVERFKERKLQMVRTAAFAAYTEIIEGSPVDTGRFRSNWMIGAGTSKKGQTLDSHTTYSKGQSVTSSEASAALSEINKLGEQSVVYITNSLDYAHALENGHSTQNEGFVARANENFVNRLKAIDAITLEN